MEESYIVKQISIFSENRPGRLAAIASALRDAEINIFAFSIAEANGFGVVRALVDRPDDAYRRLTDKHRVCLCILRKRWSGPDPAGGPD